MELTIFVSVLLLIKTLRLSNVKQIPFYDNVHQTQSNKVLNILVLLFSINSDSKENDKERKGQGQTSVFL